MKSSLLFLVFFLSILPVNSFSAEESLLGDYLDTAAIFKESFEYEKAQDVLAKAAKLGKNSELSRYRVRLLFLSGKSKQALSVFGGIKKKKWLDYFYLGLIYEDLDKTKLAKSNYIKSDNIYPNSSSLFRLGKIYLNEGNYKEASKYFLDLIKLDPGIRLAYYYLGFSLYEAGDYVRSYKYLSKAVNFYPENKKVLNRLNAVKTALGVEFFAKREKQKKESRKLVKLKSYEVVASTSLVRVGLAEGIDKFSFSCGRSFRIGDDREYFKGEANKFYTIILSNKIISLEEYETGKKLLSFSGDVAILSDKTSKEKYPFYILDVSYGRRDFWEKKIDRAYRGNLEVLLKSKGLTLVNILGLEEYLYGVLPAEIPHKAETAALQAQAIAARTIATRNIGRHRRAGYNFCADVHCQVYQGKSVEGKKTNKAVDDTAGKILIYNDKPIETFYHSTCGGCLRSDVFGRKDYLVQKRDSLESVLIESPYFEEQWFYEESRDFCAQTKGKFRWQRVYDSEDFEFVFGYGIEEIENILIKEKGDCSRYQVIEVITAKGRETIKGDLKIRNYFDKLRSSTFKVDIKFSSNKTPSMLFFWGAGFGHGAGLCQEGAISMAEQGFSYEQILKHYYPGASLQYSSD